MNKEIKIKRFILIIIGIGFLFWGFSCGVISSPSDTKIEEKIVEKEVEVEKEVIKEVEKKIEVCSKEKSWKELKKVDDEIIELSSEAFMIVSDSFIAISEYDVTRVEKNNKKIQDMTPTMIDKGIKRQGILKDLGY